LTLAFLAGVQFGIVGLSGAWLIAFPVVFLANLRTWLPVLGLRAGQLLGAMAGPAIAGAGMFAIVAAVRAQGLVGGPYRLLLFVLVGAVSYAALSLLVNRETLRDIRTLFLAGIRPPKL
jgi:hypothetical protein